MGKHKVGRSKASDRSRMVTVREMAERQRQERRRKAAEARRREAK